MIQKTRSSKKFLKKYGGGKFKFENVPSGEYIITVDFQTENKIKKRISLDDSNLNVGTIYNILPFPKYKIANYPVPDPIYLRPIPTDPVPGDTINIRHILVQLDGTANTVIVDSIIQDTVYFIHANSLDHDTLDLDQVYLIYNHFGKMIHQSRSLRNRMSDLQQRDGYILFHNGDSLEYNLIYFPPGAEVATYHEIDSTMEQKIHSLYDIYKIRSGPSYLGYSVRKGFTTGLITIGTIMGIQMIQSKSFGPILKLYSPDFSPIRKETGKYYYPMITSLSLFAIGRIAYDLYKDRRTNYILPAHENDPFPKNMFVFSLPEWIWKKSQPIVRPIMNSKPVKWWKNRKLRKLQKQAAK
ncbi:MAG TPA: hypothetical protein EYO49_07365 [Candidatus Marinimicrobia bacterium]|nr:hypothetical protein [Candidatus Neomarinimicrobiota bacterium]